MMKNLLLLIVILFALLHKSISYTRLEVWAHPNYEGEHKIFDDVDSVEWADLSDNEYLKDQVSSFKITNGSCVELFDESPPSYNGTWGWSVELDFASLEHLPLNNKIDSVKSCGNYSTSMICPNGTLVKRIRWDKDPWRILRCGIEIHCYAPNSDHAAEIIESPEVCAALGDSRDCIDGFRGVAFVLDDRRRAAIEMDPLCNDVCIPANIPKNGNTTDLCQSCDYGFALSGLNLEIEKRSGFIKEVGILCRQAPPTHFAKQPFEI